MDDLTTNIIHQIGPPYANSMQCESCGGWIVGGVIKWVNNKILCKRCAESEEKNNV